MFRICIVLAMLGGWWSARSERAVLECVADTWTAPGDPKGHGREHTLDLSSRGAAALQFRTAVIQGWRVQQVVLLLHLSGGTMPDRIRLAPLKTPFSEASATWNSLSRPRGRWRRVRTFEENWIALDLEPDEALAEGLILSGAKIRFHSRESVGFAPYLLVEGSAPSKNPVP